jgi:hypothetical protein
MKSRSGIALLGAGVLVGLQGLVFASAREAHHQSTPQAATAPVEERAFLKENEAAMAKMMNGMAAKPTGDIDRDFVAMMAPHHQGAIDMAIIELRYGRNEQLRRIAQEIIVDQLQEIDAMRLAIGDPVAAPAPAPTQADQAPLADQHGHPDMQMDMSGGIKK